MCFFINKVSPGFIQYGNMPGRVELDYLYSLAKYTENEDSYKRYSERVEAANATKDSVNSRHFDYTVGHDMLIDSI